MTAQLYSSGNNVISGNKVGIGTNSPSTSLFVKAEPYQICINPPCFNPSLYRKTSPFQVQYYYNPEPPIGPLFNPPHRTAIFVKWDGLIGIHTDNPQEKLHVVGNTLIEGDLVIKGNNSATNGTTEVKITSQGFIRARDVLIDFEEIPDYVFSKTYKLMPLRELRKYIEDNNHLPNIQSAKEFETKGNLSVSEMNLKLLEKVEELTLYILQLEERICVLEK